MRIIVKLGELFGATKLIPIHSAHIAGVSYKTVGDAAIDFLKALAEGGGRVAIPSTSNPSSVDEIHLADVLPPRLKEGQREVLNALHKMGVIPSLTCTPYYEHKPPEGSHLAWSESSAVVYANSILNAHTNREGAPSALASAVIGKTSDYGVHTPEGRRPTAVFEVETQLKNEVDFGALGYYVGKVVEEGVPLLKGLRWSSIDELKQMGASMASSGMTSLFQLKDELPPEGLERATVSRKSLDDIVERLSTSSKEEPDLVFIGCPHCSLEEVKAVARLLKGERLRDDVELWVCTSRYVKRMAEECVRIIEAAGGRVICDTCAIVTWTKELGFDEIMTNSVKAAHYAPTMNDASVRLAPLKECVKASARLD